MRKINSEQYKFKEIIEKETKNMEMIKYKLFIPTSTTSSNDVITENKIDKSNDKITIIGSGSLGIHCALSILMLDLSNDIVLFDENNIYGNDNESITNLLPNTSKIRKTSDINETVNSRIIIVAIDDTLIDTFLNEFKELTQTIIEMCPQSICIVATYPVDFLTYFTWKECNIKINRIFGIGTALESLQFRSFIAKLFDSSSQIIYGNVIGAHSICMVPVWSEVNIAGVRLKNLNKKIGLQNDVDYWNNIYHNYINSDAYINELNEKLYWNRGMIVGKLVAAILKNSHESFTVSTFVKACKHSLNNDMFFSLPCILGKNGIEYVIRQQLNAIEIQDLYKSAEILLQSYAHFSIEP